MLSHRIKELSLLSLLPATASAHHAMDGELPNSIATGFFSGIAHPVIGLDHLAFVIAIGLLSLEFTKRRLMPLAFVAFTVSGTLFHLKGYELPAAELFIALSVLGAGALIIMRTSVPWQFVVGLFAFAGMFHGYAYGESIFGAETTSVLSYLIGFAVIQYAIAIGVMESARFLIGPAAENSVTIRIAGGTVVGVAVVFLSEQILLF